MQCGEMNISSNVMSSQHKKVGILCFFPLSDRVLRFPGGEGAPCYLLRHLLQLHSLKGCPKEQNKIPPAPCTSTLKDRKTTVRQAPVLRQACACARRAVSKDHTSPSL